MFIFDWLFGRKYLKEQIKNLQSRYDILFIQNEVNQLMVDLFGDAKECGFCDKDMSFMTTTTSVGDSDIKIIELLKTQPEIREVEIMRPSDSFNTRLRGTFNCRIGGIK